jgi:transposase InsO family protein
MEVLGRDYRFETRFYLDNKRVLYVRGGGDPYLTSEELAALAGLPEALHADNGADFRSRAFAWACREEGIKLIWRPVGAPHYGGHIERLIGTVMGRAFLPRVDFRQSNGPAR